MKNRKQNIIIGVMIVGLTLIIIGTTYAYFTGSGSTVESTSTLMATGGILEIKYANNEGNELIEIFDIYPRDEEWVSKTFTVTGKNNTDLQMEYKLGLKTDNTTFTSGSLSYSLISENTSNNGEVVASINNASITDSLHYFGEGNFLTGENLVHTYTLKIYYKDNGQNQNANQGAKYAGHVIIESVEPEQIVINKIALSKDNLSAIGYTDGVVPSNLVIPEKYQLPNGEYNQVTSISNVGFYMDSTLTTLTLNEGLETIGMMAFAVSSNLTGTITMPSTLKTIEQDAFASTEITGLILNEGLETIGYNAFGWTDSLTGNIIMPSTLKSIGENAFYHTTITGLSLNEGLETIGPTAFQKAANLTGKLEIPSSVKTIGEYAFSENNITSLVLNEGIERIEEGVFYFNEGLTGEITIPSTVKYIGGYAFEVTNITKVNYPGSEEEWNQIEFGTGPFPSNVTINYNYNPGA